MYDNVSIRINLLKYLKVKVPVNRISRNYYDQKI